MPQNVLTFHVITTINTNVFPKWLQPVKGKKVKWSRYRPGVAQRLGRGIALLFHDHGNRRGWVVSSTPRPHFTPGKDPVPILQEAEFKQLFFKNLERLWGLNRSLYNFDKHPSSRGQSTTVFYTDTHITDIKE